MDEQIKAVAQQIEAILKANNLKMSVNQGIVLMPIEPSVPVPDPVVDTPPTPEPTPDTISPAPAVPESQPEPTE